MAFVKGQAKPAGSGRTKGVPNKKKYKKVADVLAEHDIELVPEILEDIAQCDEAKDRAKLKIDLLAYCEAKPKVVDVGEPEDDDSLEELTNADLLKLVKDSSGET